MKHFVRFITSALIVFCLSVLPVELPIIRSTHVEAASSVKLNKTSISIYVDNSSILTLTGTKLKITWTTSDNKIAAVSSNGVVKGIKRGTATVTAKVGSSKYNCKVTVLNPEIIKTSLDLEVADTDYLSIKGSTGTVTWKSSDNKVVTINKNGFVYAKGKGTAKITGNYKGKNYVCNVTVDKKVLHASATSVTCSREMQIMIYWDSTTALDDDGIYWNVANPSIVTCQWGEWIGDSIPLSIVLNDYGTTTITITADNTDEELVIDVTVIDDKRPKTKKLSAEDVYAKCSNATVQIDTDLGLGSGFFISSGKVVTNYHVIEGASSIKVKLNDGRTYDVEYILGCSKVLDIAILSIPIETEYLPLNNYSLKVVEAIYAIGSPLGLTDTFTNGIISNISRYDNNVDYIQINAAITHGNSGGPLINAYGEVIGINTMGYEGENLNFAINIYQLYQVDTSYPITVSEYVELISIINNNLSSANPFITNAPFEAQEGSVGKITVVFPKDWSCNEISDQGNSSQVMLYPSTSNEEEVTSNMIITVKETATALTYDKVKKYFVSQISSDAITNEFTIFGFGDVVVSDFKTSDYESKNGTVFKAEYNLSFKTAGREITVNQVIYGLCINNLLIQVVVTEAEDGSAPDIYQVAEYLLDSIEVNTQTTPNGGSRNTNPIILDNPPFEYYLSDKVNINENQPIKLDLLSSKPNEIIDDDQWFINNELTINAYQIIHVFQGTAGILPGFIPNTYDDLIITSAFYDDSYIYCIYGANYSEGYILIIYDAKSQTKLYTIDFSNYRYAPEYISEYYDYVQQAIDWAEIKDNILYISHSHSTYAKSSKNMNAYITAIDLSDFSILWRTDALVSNAYNFEIINNVIICGYGFTDEPDFLYQIDIYSGKILDKLKLKSGPSYFIKKGDILYIRTYNTDYEFKIIQ